MDHHTVNNTRRVEVILHLCAGGAVVLASLLMDDILAQPRVWGLMQSLLLAAGLILVAIGVAPIDLGLVTQISTRLCFSLLTLLVLLASAEGSFRVIGYDFAREEQVWREIPIYYRQPLTPTGDVYFKRSGPDQWTGQVLYTMLEHVGVVPNPYAKEPVITVNYDKRGFRNSVEMSDWEIAVAGDSFTELGYLAHEDLFTSVLAEKLGVSVLNLGTSFTGPLAQLSYLDDYGIGESTKQAVIVFFEGNDLSDLAREYDALTQWKRTGQRVSRQFTEQTSLVRALRDIREQVLKPLTGNDWQPVTAYFDSAEGRMPLTIVYTPPGRSDLSEETRRHLDYFFGQYADLGAARKVTVSLAYMPSKLRVLYDQVDFSKNASYAVRSWRPTDLPGVVSSLCDAHGIRFIDLTSALIAETQANKLLLYNSIYDTHVNARGSRVVGRELARYLSESR